MERQNLSSKPAAVVDVTNEPGNLFSLHDKKQKNAICTIDLRERTSFIRSKFADVYQESTNAACVQKETKM